MRPQDMARIHKAAFRDGRPWKQDEFAELLAGAGVFVAATQDCFALVRVIADEAELLTIATDPAHQRRGLARACMHDWMARATELGAHIAFLEMAADNMAAGGLYRACGFEQTGLRRNYYRREGGEPVDAILMSRPLPAP